MFRPIPAIIRFTSEGVLVFKRFVWLCNCVEIFVVLLTEYLYIFVCTHNGDGTFQDGIAPSILQRRRSSRTDRAPADRRL